MTDAMRQTASPNDRSEPPRESIQCPICDDPDANEFFSMPGVPIDTCMLYDDLEQARKAPIGDIALAYCRGCGFVFNHIYDQSKVSFKPGYEASLTYSEVFQAFQREVVARLVQRYDLRGKTIVEIGCGAGDFLKLLCEAGGNRGIGFDPSLAGETIEPAGAGSVQLIPDYYTPQYRYLDPDFVCCLSVFEDIPRPVDFLLELKNILGESRPTIYFEIFNAFHAFTHRETWSIHYEQCNYFGLRSFSGLFERCGFEVLEAATCYEGDQYLYVDAVPAGDPPMVPARRDGQPLPPEIASFAEHHQQSVTHWRERLAEYRRDGLRVVVWGSGGKGTSFLNSLDTVPVIPYVVDINPNRQGRHIGGTAQKIVPPEFLRDYRPHLVIITNPLYEREIRDQVRTLGVSCDFRTI